MKIRIEFPAEDRVHEAEAKVMQGPDTTCYLVSDDFFILIENVEDLAKEIIKFEDN